MAFAAAYDKGDVDTAYKATETRLHRAFRLKNFLRPIVSAAEANSILVTMNTIGKAENTAPIVARLTLRSTSSSGMISM